jgi:precorrin-2/cobalt-factor-2 C20-methyltransferase
MSRAHLYVIGIGPGDPELLTLKAVRALKEVRCVIVPKGQQEGASLALTIAQGAVDLSNKTIVEVHFPMVKTTADTTKQAELDTKWKAAAEIILDVLKAYKTAAFITLGDPSIYSTYYYVHPILKDRLPEAEISFVPGISSINASACCASIPLTLGNERLAVLPATYEDEGLEAILRDFDTVILMKVHKVFDRIVAILERLGLLNQAIYISHVGMKDQRIYQDLRGIAETERDYFSLIIVKKTRPLSL